MNFFFLCAFKKTVVKDRCLQRYKDLKIQAELSSVPLIPHFNKTIIYAVKGGGKKSKA